MYNLEVNTESLQFSLFSRDLSHREKRFTFQVGDCHASLDPPPLPPPYETFCTKLEMNWLSTTLIPASASITS
jgi:hypothetical protein